MTEHGDSRSFSPHPSQSTSVRGLRLRTLGLGTIVALTAACGGGGDQATVRLGRPTGSESERPSATSQSPAGTSIATPEPTRSNSPSTPGARPAPSNSALLMIPEVGPNPSAPVESLILATGDGRTTGDPQPPPNTVSLEDLYRLGQVDESK